MISVIVPVYNTRPYIRACVQSVLAQTYPQFELLLADDGSQDGSREICRELCAADGRIRLLCREHRGVSAARNAAMQAAGGEYLFFLDSDDAIHPCLLEALFRLAEGYGAGLATACCSAVSEGFRLFPCEAAEEGVQPHIYLQNRELMDWPDQGSATAGILHGPIGGKLVRRAGSPPQFDESLCNGEDTKFLYQLISGGADAVLLKRDWYYYRRRPAGSSWNRSVEACRSMYQSERYLCSQERAAGRLANAGFQERLLVDRLLEWYRLSRSLRDRELTRYLKKTAAAEKRSPAFALLPPRYRAKFYGAFYGYALYRPVHACLRRRWERKERRRAQNG
ncbi:MAG: glycosyltransferase family 2 protein [Provencibacterium sp.]|nr:glycosyltransferase family 2 protein [Provencibacterium sp.]